MLNSTEFFLVFLGSGILCGLVTPIMKRSAIRFGIVDTPNQAHKTHVGSIPYLGGVAIVIAVLLVSAIGFIALDFTRESVLLAISVLIPALILGLVGLVDDVRQLSPMSRFVAQSISGTFTASLLIITNTVGSPTGLDILDFAITVFWIVGVTNSINFFDNHDGGASGTVAITSLVLFFLAYDSGQIFIAGLAIILSGACSGFLFWNRSPARIYMGDAGALFLGTLIASLLVRYDPNPIDRLTSFSIPIFLLAIPILDTTVAVVSRLRRRKSPFHGGKDHLSHRLMRLGFSRKKTAITLWALTGFFGSLALVISNAPYHLERRLMYIGALIWIVLIAFFLRQRDE